MLVWYCFYYFRRPQRGFEVIFKTSSIEACKKQEYVDITSKTDQSYQAPLPPSFTHESEDRQHPIATLPQSPQAIRGS